MSTNFLSALGLFGLGLSAYGQPAAKVDLPPPYHSPSVRNAPQVIDRPGGARLQLPAGFKIEEFATDFDSRPRFMLLASGGEILLSETIQNGSVWVLFDKNKDFKAEDRKKLIGGLDRPYGMALWKEYLYVSEPSSVKRFKFDPKALTAGPGEEVVSLAGFEKGHTTRTLLFSPDGSKLYVTVGSMSNVSAGEPALRAAIHEYNPDGTGHVVVATGTRNPVGLRFYPGTKDLWAAIQERDELGDDLVPDYFTKIQRGGFYGWPYAYIGPNEDPRRKGEAPDLVKKTNVPDVVLGAHVAVLDFIFYTGKQFPAEYQGGAFLVFHGSWNRANRVGYSVAFVPFKDGKPTTDKPQDFLTGFMLSPDKREVWGRPVGLLQLPDGSILVSDDGGKKIWRISYGK
jgi:glucose/arabinose dehydrogenase